MNRRDFLKSTAALATVAVAGKASIEPVSPPALLCPVDLGFGKATWRLAKTGNCFDRPEPAFRIDPIPNHIFVQWPPWRDK